MGTKVVVGGVIGAAVVWLAWTRLPAWAFVTVCVLLAWEAWTLLNGVPGDTISETVRWFSRRQLMVPWLFGTATGMGIASGYVADPYVIAALLFLQGHFFFTLEEGRTQ